MNDRRAMTKLRLNISMFFFCMVKLAAGLLNAEFETYQNT
jgi:hypothetical protein